MMMRRALAALLTALALTPVALVATSSPAAGAAGDTHVVNTTTDAPDDDTNDGVCETAAGECSLRAALEQAQADHEDGVSTIVQVPAGELVLTEGQLYLYNANVRVSGAGAGETIIVGGGLGGVERHLELNVDGELVVTLEDMTFRGGETEDMGGSIQSQGGATLTVRRMHFEDNTSGYNGGAIAAEGNPELRTLVVEDTTFVGNEAAFAGGAVHVGGDETATITNSTFNDNSAGYYGGALSAGNFESAPGGTATVTHATFSGNRAAAFEESTGGGAIAVNGATVTLISSIVEASIEGATLIPQAIGDPLENCVVLDDGVLTSGGGNVVDDDTCNATEATDQPNTAAGAAALADNGGPTFTMAIADDSPAIDAAGATCSVPDDQRGVARPQDGNNDGTNGCDSGAFELPAVEVPVEEPDPEPTPPAAQPVVAAPSFTG